MSDISMGNLSVDSRIGEESQDSPEKKNRVRKVFFYAWTAIGFCILAGVIVYLLNVLAMPVSLIIWTVVIVFCLRGVVEKLENRGVNRAIGTCLAYALMFVVLALLGFFAFSPVFGLNDQFKNLITSLPGYVDQIRAWAEHMMKEYSSILENDWVQSMLSQMDDSVSSWGASIASTAADTAVNLGSGVASAFTAIGFALVIGFWILMELPAIGKEANRIVNPKFADQAEFLHLTFTRILGGYIKGTIIQCLLIGIGCGILYAIVGVPNAPALGVITGVFNIIPIVGPWLGGIAAAISAVFVSPLTAVIVVIGVLLIQSVVYTFVSPKIMSNSVDIHPALTLIAMIFGSAIGGAMSGLMGSIVGMLLAIPAVAVMKSCFVFYFERSTGRQVVATDGFLFKGTPSKTGVADPFHDATGGVSKKDGAKRKGLLEKHKEKKAQEKKAQEEKKGEGN